MERKKVLGFKDLVLFTFCAMFGVEAIPAVAAIGPSAISWWLICTIGFFLPFGLITAELGSTYTEQGGIYVWIKRGLGDKWAGRSIWYYWIALPIWLPAMYIAISDIIGHMFFPEMSLWHQVFMSIVMIWVVVGINLCSLKFSKWVPNIGAITRFIVVFGMLAAAIVYFIKNKGFVNEITFAGIIPNLNAAFVFVPMIIYNLIGFELMSGAAGEMKNPARDIPKAVIMSALIIISFYLISTIAIWVIVPIQEINVASGILQLFLITFESFALKQLIIVTLGILISVTLFSEIVTWTLGENRIVAEAAQDGKLPRVLGKMSKVSMAPIGASFVSGIISTVIIIIYGLFARNAAEMFWQVISFSTIVGLFSYAILFPVFIILRFKDKQRVRPYRIPGPGWFAVLLAIMAEVFVLITILVLAIQPGSDFTRTALPIIIGVIIAVITGEFLVSRSLRQFSKLRSSGG
ncbi:MAG: APC family permease [Candidatus Omnitrophica bacterium]|jgi:amino acid transporter|nr:APC family permease [Candidatus Omnitrophota bacterium]MDD3987566.1 APC family permease [Candidatus Omnitrophota bacterium]MDD5665002.1 APC family permease [Candidatus Omnitrophota bacterium]